MSDANQSIQSIDKQLIEEDNSLSDLLFHKAPEALVILESKNFSIIDCNNKAVELFEAGEKTTLLNNSFFRLIENEPTDFSKNLLELNIRKDSEHTQDLIFRTCKQNVFWGQLNKSKFGVKKNQNILLRINKSVDHFNSEETLITLLRGTARVTGAKFLKELTRLLCTTFNVNSAFIGKLSDDSKTLQIVESSNSKDTRKQENYALDDTVFENVLRGYTTFYPKGAKELFPADNFVKVNGVEGFMGTPIFEGTGAVVGLLGFYDDKPINEIPNARYILSIFASRAAAEILRIRSKEILKEQARDLSNSNAVKDKLLSVISHDLINPLHTIMGFSELLRNKIEIYEKEKIIERVEIIDNSIRNIYFLLDNLTSWSNFYRNNSKLSRDFISLKELIDENLSLFKYIIEIKELDIKFAENITDTIYSDRRMVSSILRNIISNAVKFTPKHGEVSIKLRINDSGIIIRIEDNGIGISPEELKRINKVDKNNADQLFRGKTFGLGLLLSRSQAELIGGSIKISSDINKGTCVNISLPKA